MNFYNELQKYSSNVAVVTERSEQISYKDLLDAADKVGDLVKKRCLIFAVCKNSFESIAGYLGLMRAGAVLVLVNQTIHSRLFENLIGRYRPEYLYLPKERADLAGDAKIVGECGDYALLKTGGVSDYELHGDLALLLTTSGSTGSPKLVRLSYENIRSNAKAIAHYLGILPTSRPITTMPMSYSYGLSIINSHLITGSSIILNEATFMEGRFWEAVKQHKATTFGGVPYTYEMLKKLRFDQMNLPSLQYVTQAGGKLSPELSAEFVETCGKKGIKFYVMYGQTEATARMSYLPWEHARAKSGSIGIPIPGGDFWIEDDDGKVVDAHHVHGELVYKGENVSWGYAESCMDLSHGNKNQGILRTGDLAKQDEEGFYYIVGRKKRFLKMSGNRVNLDDVEQIVREAGYDCACAGADDDLKIYVAAGSENLQIKNYVSERTGIHHSRVSVVEIGRIPRNEAGKILYAELDADV